MDANNPYKLKLTIYPNNRVVLRCLDGNGYCHRWEEFMLIAEVEVTQSDKTAVTFPLEVTTSTKKPV